MPLPENRAGAMNGEPDPKAIVAAGYDEVARRYQQLEAPDRKWPRMRRLRELLPLLPDGSQVHGDVMSLDFGEDSFDAIVAFYVVEHLPREEHPDLLARFCRWLRPGGYLLFTIEPTDQPGRLGTGSERRCSSASSAPTRRSNS
jgi:SAM-dependent methyltransferase